MDIPRVFPDKETQRRIDQNGYWSLESQPIVTIETIKGMQTTGPYSIKQCVLNNLDKFPNGESNFLIELADSKDVGNLIMAIAIINSK